MSSSSEFPLAQPIITPLNEASGADSFQQQHPHLRTVNQDLPQVFKDAVKENDNFRPNKGSRTAGLNPKPTTTTLLDPASTPTCSFCLAAFIITATRMHSHPQSCGAQSRRRGTGREIADHRKASAELESVLDEAQEPRGCGGRIS